MQVNYGKEFIVVPELNMSLWRIVDRWSLRSKSFHPFLFKFFMTKDEYVALESVIQYSLKKLYQDEMRG